MSWPQLSPGRPGLVHFPSPQRLACRGHRQQEEGEGQFLGVSRLVGYGVAKEHPAPTAPASEA